MSVADKFEATDDISKISGLEVAHLVRELRGRLTAVEATRDAALAERDALLAHCIFGRRDSVGCEVWYAFDGDGPHLLPDRGWSRYGTEMEAREAVRRAVGIGAEGSREG